MQVAIGLIQIAAGILLGFSVWSEYNEHGALIAHARPHDEPIRPATQFCVMLLIVSLLGGGLYFLKPANLCGL